MLYALIAVALFSWLVDKMVHQVTLVGSDKKEVGEIKNKYNPIELGYNRALDSRYPWRTDRNHRIGDLHPGNPKPFIDIPEQKRKLAVSDGRQDYILENAKNSAYKLVHERYNLETHHRFDPDFGDQYPRMTPWRKSKVAYLYE